MFNSCVVDEYLLKATNSGIDVFSINTEFFISNLYMDNLSTICFNNPFIYIGTTNSGIFRTTLSGGLLDYPTSYLNYPTITDNYIQYTHSAGNYLCVTTNTGVNQINLLTLSGISTTVLGAEKCFQTIAGCFYYTVSGILNAVYDNSTSWTSSNVGYTYLNDDSIIPLEVLVKDISIAEGTSLHNNDNVLFLATSSGVVVIEERRGDELMSRVKYYYLEN